MLQNKNRLKIKMLRKYRCWWSHQKNLKMVDNTLRDTEGRKEGALEPNVWSPNRRSDHLYRCSSVNLARYVSKIFHSRSTASELCISRFVLPPPRPDQLALHYLLQLLTVQNTSESENILHLTKKIQQKQSWIKLKWSRCQERILHLFKTSRACLKGLLRVYLTTKNIN